MAHPVFSFAKSGNSSRGPSLTALRKCSASHAESSKCWCSRRVASRPPGDCCLAAYSPYPQFLAVAGFLPQTWPTGLLSCSLHEHPVLGCLFFLVTKEIPDETIIHAVCQTHK